MNSVVFLLSCGLRPLASWSPNYITTPSHALLTSPEHRMCTCVFLACIETKGSKKTGQAKLTCTLYRTERAFFPLVARRQKRPESFLSVGPTNILHWKNLADFSIGDELPSRQLGQDNSHGINISTVHLTGLLAVTNLCNLSNIGHSGSEKTRPSAKRKQKNISSVCRGAGGALLGEGAEVGLPHPACL